MLPRARIISCQDSERPASLRRCGYHKLHAEGRDRKLLSRNVFEWLHMFLPCRTCRGGKRCQPPPKLDNNFALNILPIESRWIYLDDHELM